MQTPRAKRGRIVELDGVRGLAALGVVLYHYCQRLHELYPEIDGVLGWTRAGLLGVPVFFVLSGYVISLSTKGRSTREFLLGRAARILPTYWFAVTLTHVGVSVFSLPGRQVGFLEFLANYTLFARLAGVPDVDGVYWSLGVEAIFYLAVACAMTLSIWERRQVLILSAWIAVALGWSVLGLAGEAGQSTNSADISDVIGYFLVVEYAGYFVGGAALSLLHRGVVGSGHLALLVGASAWSSYLYGGIPYLSAFVVAVVVIHISYVNGIALLRSGPLVWLGSLSYALYLVHQNLGFIALRSLDGNGVGRHMAVLIVLIGALGVSHLVHHFVEARAARWVRERQRASRQASSSASVRSSVARR